VEVREVDLPAIDDLRRHGLVERWRGSPVDPAVEVAAAGALAEIEPRSAASDPTARLLAAQYREIELVFERDR
jgi:hypothetical protein